MLHQFAEFVAVLSCSLFAGASVYINLVEHPARMECGVEVAATEFSPSYRRATVMQATLAAVGLVSSIAAWLAGATFWWLVAGALLGSVIPFTLFVILPTNKLLLGPTLDRRSVEAERLLARWGEKRLLKRFARPLSLENSGKEIASWNTNGPRGLVSVSRHCAKVCTNWNTKVFFGKSRNEEHT